MLTQTRLAIRVGKIIEAIWLSKTEERGHYHVHRKELERLTGEQYLKAEDLFEMRNWSLDKVKHEYGDVNRCDECGINFHGMISLGSDTLWDTPSGKLEPGCMYWADWLPENMYWDNHRGAHLHCVLPNGLHWNIDARASNCDQKEERTHRCWVRHGEPPVISVDKNGHTCGAGGGSIAMGNFHGFLTNGVIK